MEELTVREMEEIEGGATTLECAMAGLAVGGGVYLGFYVGAFMAFVWASENCW